MALNQSLDGSFSVERIKKVISMSLASCAANLALQKQKKVIWDHCVKQSSCEAFGGTMEADSSSLDECDDSKK